MQGSVRPRTRAIGGITGNWVIVDQKAKSEVAVQEANKQWVARR